MLIIFAFHNWDLTANVWSLFRCGRGRQRHSMSRYLDSTLHNHHVGQADRQTLPQLHHLEWSPCRLFGSKAQLFVSHAGTLFLSGLCSAVAEWLHHTCGVAGLKRFCQDKNPTRVTIHSSCSYLPIKYIVE